MVAWIGVFGETLETFGAAKQESFVTALAGHVGVNSEDVSLVAIAESRAEGADMEVLVEIADASGSSSLSAIAAQIEDGVSSGSIGSDLVADGMSVQLSVLAGPEVFGDPVLAHATAALGLSGLSVEDFVETSGDILIGVVASVVGVSVDDVSIISVADSGAPLLEVGVSMVFPDADAASEAAARVTAAVLDGSLASELAQAGLGVSVALLEAVEVSVGAPPYSAPTITESRAERAVVAWIGVFGETVETFGAVIGVLVEIADTRGSSSLSALVAHIEDGLSS